MTAPRHPLAALLLASLGLNPGTSAFAEPLRDPTLAPAAIRAAESASAAGPACTPPCSAATATGTADDAVPRHIMTINGRPHVIERGWPRGVGDRLGTARIERIDTSAIWLREDGVLRRVPLYAGVQVRPSRDDTPGERPATRRARTPAPTPSTRAPAASHGRLVSPDSPPLNQEARP